VQEKREHAVLQKIVELVNNDFFRQVILVNTVNEVYFENGHIEIYSDNQAFFDKHISVPFLRKFIQKKYNDTEQKLSMLPEELSSEILKRLENTSADSIMKTILETNKGSVIYIDFWGTWCGPCIAAMREAEPFVKRLKNDVVFVYLCLDSERDGWEKTSKVMGIGEHNYFLNAKQSSDMRVAFEIQGIPFYMLIDKNGTIVNKGNNLRIYDSTVFNKIVELTRK
jgi:thiol-disulfide isomerase/thioredoxin